MFILWLCVLGLHWDIDKLNLNFPLFWVVLEYDVWPTDLYNRINYSIDLITLATFWPVLVFSPEVNPSISLSVGVYKEWKFSVTSQYGLSVAISPIYNNLVYVVAVLSLAPSLSVGKENNLKYMGD